MTDRNEIEALAPRRQGEEVMRKTPNMSVTLAIALAASLAPEAFTPRGPRERDSRTAEDIDERAAKQAAKLARRAARHKRETAPNLYTSAATCAENEEK
jgi:predicted nucleic acid-binding protein